MNKEIPKLFQVMKSYTKAQFAKDVTAGVIVAIIALPLSIALALASGVRPEQGLYTAIIAGFVIALLGGSRVQVSGPTAAFATIVAGIVATKGMSGLVVATILAGMILIAMGLLKLGSLIRFIPYPIVSGFTAGIAVTIIIGQLKDFFGLTFSHSPVESLEKLAECFASKNTFNPYALLIGVIALAILIFWTKINAQIPPSLIAILVTGALTAFFFPQVNTIGDLYEISSKLPVPSIPTFSLHTVRELLPDALTLAILAAIESLLSCVVADGMIHDRHNSNMELIAQGAGNICSGIFGGIPATGAIARTAANVKNGGRTPISSMVHSIVLLLVLVLLMPYAALIPMPAIAAILFTVAYNMSGWKEVVRLIKTSPKSDAAVLVTTFILTIVFDLVIAIEIGMLLTGILFLKRMSDVAGIRSWKYVDEPTDDLCTVPAGTLVYEVMGPMFFAVADEFSRIIRDKSTEVVILRMGSVPAMDASALLKLQNVHQTCVKNGVILILSHVNSQPCQMMEKAGFLAEVGDENICESIEKALQRAASITK